MDENNSNSKKALTTTTLSEFERLGDEFVENLEGVFEEYPQVGKTLVSFWRLFSIVVRAFGETLPNELEAIKLDLRASIDEVVEDYTEFEASELKRRVEQVFEKQDKLIERHAEMLQNIQDLMRREDE